MIVSLPSEEGCTSERNWSTFACPNPPCSLHGQAGQSNLRPHGWSNKSQGIRCRRCTCCGNNVSERKGTPLFGLHMSDEKARGIARHPVEGNGMRPTGPYEESPERRAPVRPLGRERVLNRGTRHDPQRRLLNEPLDSVNGCEKAARELSLREKRIGELERHREDGAGAVGEPYREMLDLQNKVSEAKIALQSTTGERALRQRAEAVRQVVQRIECSFTATGRIKGSPDEQATD